MDTFGIDMMPLNQWLGGKERLQMKFDLTLAVVLAFLVPGVVFLWALPPELSASTGVIPTLGASTTTTEIIVLVCVAFVAGVAMDSLRIVSVQPLVGRVARCIKKEGLPQDYISHITATRLPVFEMLVSRSYEYYRLNCNLTVSLLAAMAASAATCSYGTRFIVLAVLSVLAFGISLRSKLDNDSAVRQFVNTSETGQ